jgi:hypothetical protein
MNDQGPIEIPSPSFMRDACDAVFSPKRFYHERFLNLKPERIHKIGFFCTTFGFLVGGLLLFALSFLVKKDFLKNPDNYKAALEGLGMTASSFSEMINVQESYGLLLASLSWLIALMAPHLFGGALFLSLRLLQRSEKALSYPEVLDCAKMALSSMAFYAIIALGPLLSLVFFSLNCFRALKVRFGIGGFMTSMSIVSAIYVSFFLAAASLQQLALALALLIVN